MSADIIPLPKRPASFTRKRGDGKRRQAETVEYSRPEWQRIEEQLFRAKLELSKAFDLLCTLRHRR